MQRTIERFLCAGFLAALIPGTGAGQDSQSWTIRAATVYTAAGDSIENGVVRVQDGKIVAVGTSGGGGDVLEVAAVTPGLVDLSLMVDTGHASVEQTTEVEPSVSVTGSLDLFSFEWDRALRSGVTTALAVPADFNVIGGLGAVLKTGGPPTLEARLVLQDACLRAAMGSQPSSGNRAPRFSAPANFYFRRPTTRMGVEWTFRKAFYDALQGLGGDEPEAQRDREVLSRVMRGELPLSVRARATQDIRTTLFLKEEFGIPMVILHDAVEAWREPELLVRSGAAVVLPPIPADGRVPDGYVNDSYFIAMDSANRLHELGVPFALSGHGNRDVGTRIADQAGLAMRGGLPFEAALAAVTLTPARLIGVADRVGSIEVGKDADLVLWSGKPFETTSGIVGVIVDGRLVVDPRPASR
jgi:imidazolonepropionase-like amidohydrolase